MVAQQVQVTLKGQARDGTNALPSFLLPPSEMPFHSPQPARGITRTKPRKRTVWSKPQISCEPHIDCAWKLVTEHSIVQGHCHRIPSMTLASVR